MFAFATGCLAQNYLQDSVCSLAHFRADARPVGHTGADNAGNLSRPPAHATNVPWEPPRQVGSVENLAVCLSHSPSAIWPNIHFVFYPAGSGNKKRKRQSTADPDSETTSSSDSDSSSTVDTSTSEDEKDFILPDYPSDELTSSESSDSEPEEAPAENLSTGWSERVTLVDTQFHGGHVGPQKISQTTSTPRAPHCPSSSFSSTPISGGGCAAKQTCEPSRSRSPSPLHTTPRILRPSLSPS